MFTFQLCLPCGLHQRYWKFKQLPYSRARSEKLSSIASCDSRATVSSLRRVQSEVVSRRCVSCRWLAERLNGSQSSRWTASFDLSKANWINRIVIMQWTGYIQRVEFRGLEIHTMWTALTSSFEYSHQSKCQYPAPIILSRTCQVKAHVCLAERPFDWSFHTLLSWAEPSKPHG